MGLGQLSLLKVGQSMEIYEKGRISFLIYLNYNQLSNSFRFNQPCNQPSVLVALKTELHLTGCTC